MTHFDARWQRPETLRAIFDQISDAVFFYDKNLVLVGVNKSGEKLFGLSADEMLGQPCSALFHVAADLPSDSDESAYLPTGTLTLLDHGREHRVIVRGMELLDEAGRLEGLVATVTDLTERALETDVDLNERPGARPPAAKYHPIVLRNRMVATVAGGVLLCLIAVLTVGRYWTPGKQLTPEERRLVAAREATARFNAMSPAQHIERAKLALRPGATSDAILDGLRHLKVIPPSAPEAGRAEKMRMDLTKAANLANAQSLIDAASNADVREGMEKLQRANLILDEVTRQYPADKSAPQLSQASQTTAEQLAIRFPHEFAAAETKLVDFSWQKGGFGTVMIANFTVRNDSPVDVGDLKIKCENYAASGVLLDQNDGTAFAIVKAHATTRIPNVNMGFLNSESGTPRTTKTDCEIQGLKLASESQAFSSRR
ncbi:MAG TPA: PAS domain S-box protein [Bryobacteraceae bacterium]|nr:PAS domain S-box protein [Bryobacteraceae bacterium]